MLKIRQAQLDELSRAHARTVATEVEALIGPSFPALRARLGDGAFRELVVRHVIAAGGYRIDRLSSVARYVSVACALWPGFEDEPPQFEWARAILGAGDLTAEGKVSRLAWWTRRELAERKAT